MTAINMDKVMRGWRVGCVCAAVLVGASVPAVAQEGGWGSDVEDFSVQRPARLKAEPDPAAADFGAALEAAAAAEGRPAPAAAEPAPEFVPKNEIIITKNPNADSAAQKAEKKEKKPKGDGKVMNNTVGGRIGFGNIIGLGLDVGIGTAEAQRINVSTHIGYFTFGGTKISASEMLAFYEWCFNISDEFKWFIGPGAALGLYGTSWMEKTTGKQVSYGFSGGVGGRTGFQIDLMFIDPEHSLSSLRNSTVSVDVRPIFFYVPKVGNKYPGTLWTVGIAFNHVFGGDKK